MATLIPSMIAAISAIAAPASPSADATPREVVSAFFEVVRSGEHPELAERYMAPKVAAHQLTSEGQLTIIRTPGDYAEHVRDFQRLFGQFEVHVDEMIAEGDRVYVRWHQAGHHLASLDGEQPTGKDLTDIASAVYRVSDGRITEYWIQSDRKGLEVQVAQRASK